MEYTFTELDPLTPTRSVEGPLADLFVRIGVPRVQTAAEVSECIAVAARIFCEIGGGEDRREELPADQALFAAHVCVDEYIKKGGTLLLRSGAAITRDSVLTAVALMQLDRALRSLRIGDAGALAIYLADLYFHAYCDGYEHGAEVASSHAQERVSTTAQKAARASHREVRSFHEDVFRAYFQNHARWGSKNVAAREIAKLVPLKERTIRDLLQGIEPGWGPGAGDD